METNNQRLIKRLETLKIIHDYDPIILKSLDKQIKNINKQN